MVGTSRQLALSLFLVYSAVSGAAGGAAGTNPLPVSTRATRVGTTAEPAVVPAVPLTEQLVQHEQRREHERSSFAKSWVTRARGGGSRVTADGGTEREKNTGRGGDGGGGKDEVELALVGNFPNR